MVRLAEQPDQCPCSFPLELLLRHVVQAEGLTPQQRGEVVEHIAQCEHCANIYEALCDADMELWDEAAKAAGLPERQLEFTRSPEEGIVDLWQRVDEDEACQRRQDRRATLFRIGKFAAAMAACLMLVVMGGWLLSERFKAASAVAPQASTERVKERALQAAVRATPMVDDDLLGSIHNDSWRAPDPPDVDTLVYAQWRDEHRQLFPILASLQQLLARDQPAKLDPVELMMVSGDIWQFHYDPKLPPDQALARLEPAAMTRLAKYYGVDAREMLRTVGLPDSTPIAALPVQNPTLGEQYADALRRWHEALTTTKPDGSEHYRNLLAFSLNASRFLSDNRTAAYLWAKTFPQRAQRLLPDSSYLTVIPMPPTAPDYDAWLKQLRKEAVAARSCEHVAMEWFLVPTGNDCVPEASQQQRALAAMVVELLPTPGDRRQEHTGQ